MKEFDYNDPRGKKKKKKKQKTIVIPFILLSLCFTLWGYANNVTAPMINSFSRIFHITYTDASLVNVTSYFAYFVMSIPAAIIIRRFRYKSGVLIGLLLLGVGALLFFPARQTEFFYSFLGAYFVMTCGNAFLETTCSPFVYSIGEERHALRRLNLAQSFNAVGAFIGLFLANQYVQKKLSRIDENVFAILPENQFRYIVDHDLDVLIQPYMLIGVLAIALAVLIVITRDPMKEEAKPKESLKEAFGNLAHSIRFRNSALALFFYIGAQTCCWSFMIIYGKKAFVDEGMNELSAETVAAQYQLAAIFFFAINRFICTWLIEHIKPSLMLRSFAIAAIASLFGAMVLGGRNGVYCLVLTSVCMSMMFPTIYGMALNGLKDRMKVASAVLIMMLIGGSIIPMLQVLIIDNFDKIIGFPAVNFSFIVPLICMVVIALYAHIAYMAFYNDEDDSTVDAKILSPSSENDSDEIFS